MKKTLLIALILWVGRCAGQTNSLPDVKSSSFLQSPNAANLGQYGSIDVSPFTGLPNIGIKVFSLTHGDITVNASLNYLGGGVKPEDHPGWVGQNWTLNVGGVVTRKRNGGVDEVYNSVNSALPDQFAYWFQQNYSILSDNNWATKDFLQAHPAGNPQAVSLALLSPDEFFFTLPNGKSGSFFKDHTGKMVVKSNQPGKMLVTADLNSTPVTLINPRLNHTHNDELNITRIIQKIVIIDDDGFKYTFGDNVDAIEFIRSPRNIGISTPSYSSNEDVVANAWFLVKIESPKKNVVNFNYTRGFDQFVPSSTYGHTISYSIQGSSGSCDGRAINPAGYAVSLINPSYLSDISCSSFTVTFDKEVSDDPYLYGANGTYAPYNNFVYSDISQNHHSDSQTNGQSLLDDNKTTWYKLRMINVTDFNNVPKESYSFGYNNDDGSSKRLFLNRFTRQHATLPGSLPDDPSVLPLMNYKFAYRNPELLPRYGSFMTDEWGYYNGRSYPFDQTFLTPTDLQNTLVNNFLPDTILMAAGTLKTITYPTGGYTAFAYEANDFGERVNRTPNSVSLTNINGIGGGLRIKKIINYSMDGPPTWKEYIYKKSQNPGISSGISAGRKQYLINAQVGVSPSYGYATYISNNSITDLDYTNGRDIIYSEVKEKFNDGSYNIFKYTTQENSNYQDEVSNIYSSGYVISSTDYGPEYFTAASSYTYPVTAHTSRDMERGQLLSKVAYNASDIPVLKQENQYRDDAGRFEDYVRAFDYQQQTISCSVGSVSERYIEPVKHYTYFPYLKSQTETTYDVAGNNPVTKIHNFTYDNTWRQLSEESYTDSKSNLIRTVYKHPYDVDPSDDPNGQAANMTAITSNIISPVLKATKYNGSTQLAASKAIYSQPASNFIVPTSTFAQAQSMQPVYETGTIHKYDTDNGNILSKSKTDAPKTSYIWGYNKQYPIASAANAAWNEIYANSLEDITDFPSGVSQDFTKQHTGRASGQIYDPGSSENYYHSNTTLQVSLNAKKRYRYSGWFYSDGPTYDLYLFQKRAGETGYFSYINVVSNSQTGGWVYVEGTADVEADVTQLNLRVDNNGGGNVWFDDLRICPADALMTTYTYDPLVGLTSITDPKGESTYYEYDIYNRLVSVKDKDHSITKAMCYNLRGQSTGCPVPGMFYNDQQSGNFTKNDCTNGTGGDPVNYVIPANTFSSSVSKSDANTKALAALPVYGQAYANINGNCVFYTHVKQTSSYDIVDGGYTATVTTYAIAAYADAACTLPLTLSTPVTVNFKIATLLTYGAGDPDENYTANYSVVIQAGTSESSIGDLSGGCRPAASRNTMAATKISATQTSATIRFQTAKKATSGGTTNGLPPDDPPGDPHPSSLCEYNTITILPGVGYIPVN